MKQTAAKRGLDFDSDQEAPDNGKQTESLKRQRTTLPKKSPKTKSKSSPRKLGKRSGRNASADKISFEA